MRRGFFIWNNSKNAGGIFGSQNTSNYESMFSQAQCVKSHRCCALLSHGEEENLAAFTYSRGLRVVIDAAHLDLDALRVDSYTCGLIFSRNKNHQTVCGEVFKRL